MTSNQASVRVDESAREFEAKQETGGEFKLFDIEGMSVDKIKSTRV